MMGMSCYILADTFFISVANGTLGIAALNLTLPVYGLLFAIGSLIGIGSATRYSLCKMTDNETSRLYFSNAVMFAVLIGIGFTLLGNFFPAEILKLMGADADILSIGTEYLQIAMLFSPFFIANYTFTAFVRNDNAPNIAMAATLLSSLFNIVFDYVFMFPMHMGMRGAALATGVSPIISIGICMIHYLSKKNTIVFKWHLPSFKLLASAAGLGVVAFVGEIANSITTLVFNFILLALSGNNAVAAYGVIANIALVGTAIFNGVSQGLQPLASTSYGHGDKEDVKKILRQSLVIAVILSIVLVSAVWVFAQGLVGIFNSAQSAELAKFAVPGLQSLDKGQMEAARSVGMTYWQAMFHIILPQAFRRMLPPLGNNAIAILKDSSLVSAIGLAELAYAARTVAGATARYWEPYITISLMYWVMTLGLAYLVKKMEQRLGKGDDNR